MKQPLINVEEWLDKIVGRGTATRRTKWQPNTRHAILLLLMPALLWMACAESLLGSERLGAGTNSLWDISKGTAIVNHSALNSCQLPSDPRDMFGGTFLTCSQEPYDTIFADGNPAGHMNFIEWHMPTNVTVQSLDLLATGDSPSSTSREFAGFTLRAKSPGSPTFDRTLFAFVPTTHPYTYISNSFALLISTNIPTVTAQDFRAEFTNLAGVFNGPRIIELDAFSQPRAPIATATALVTNGFLTIVKVTWSGWGYTNTPAIQLVGGGGSGAELVAVVSNGLVTAVNVLNPGSGYTSAPVLVIAPPYLPEPRLTAAPMSFLSFSNLTVSSIYQLQQWTGYYWSNVLSSFTATNALYTQIVAGVAGSVDYRLALSPALATANVSGGFVVGLTVTSGGSGYVTSPTTSIVDGCGGSNATAVAYVSGGAVTNITVTNPGIHYSCAPSVVIAPASSISPSVVLPMVNLSSTGLVPYDNYQIQFTPNLTAGWADWNGGPFSTPTVSASYLTNSQNLLITNSPNVGFFRLKHLP